MRCYKTAYEEIPNCSIWAKLFAIPGLIDEKSGLIMLFKILTRKLPLHPIGLLEYHLRLLENVDLDCISLLQGRKLIYLAHFKTS